MAEAAIKSMKLYAQVERIFNELRRLGIGDDDPLDVATLSRFDQFHYFGTEAVDTAIAALGLDAGKRVLEIGSGIGGPARYLAHAAGCRVTALELQADLDEVARGLTARCGLAGRVEHVRGDVLTTPLAERGYDAVVSWLTFYHIPQRDRLFAKCAAALGPGGMFYAEDLFRHADFDRHEARLLTEKLYGLAVPPRDAYVDDLAAAGFAGIHFDDVTPAWARFTIDRRTAYHAAWDDAVAIHGEAIVAGLADFYGAVATLFESGKLGGARITARKP